MNRQENDHHQNLNINNSTSYESNRNSNLKIEKISKIIAIAMFFILTILIFYIFINFSNKKEVATKPIKSNIVNIKLNGKILKTTLENQFIIIETAYNPSSRTQEIIKIDGKNGNEISRIILNF